jgi:hypothetical protein
MGSVEWTLFLVSEITGAWMEHWVGHTREECRRWRRVFLTHLGDRKIPDVQIKIVKTRDTRQELRFEPPNRRGRQLRARAPQLQLAGIA